MKKTNITLSIALAAVFSASTAFAEAEVTGKIVHESAKFTTSGTTIGAASSHGKDVMKTETSARIYIDGEADQLQEGATYHVELNLMRDSKGIGKYDGNESYTQRDALREAYVDTELNDWSIRAGKQQVVWGTADGMKLLDMINPTDYSEMAQNQMEDSRIPVWMVNAEKTNEDSSEFQVVVSQPKENVFAGLDRNIDTSVRTTSTIAGHSVGQPFVMKGVDSITGSTNGFLNITPEIGALATGFYNTFSATVADGGLNSSTALGTSAVTVGQFSDGTMNGAIAVDGFGTTIKAYAGVEGSGTTVLNSFIGGYGYSTNLMNAAGSSTYTTDGSTNQDSAFEYMQNTVFGTFDTLSGAKSKYRYNMPDNADADIAMRYKNTLDSGLNYSINYSNAYDKNPIINLSWEYSDGTKLTKSVGDGTTSINSQTIANKIYLHDGTNYVSAQTSTDAPILVFEQKVERAHNLGGSFDMAIETAELGPVVIRGEALYQKDVYSPVMNKASLSIGDLSDALTMVKGDKFKFVLGADVTALTNMMVSVQFIQESNLDYIDTTSTTAGGSSGAKFTADYATMHLTNGFNKAIENKNFYSLFFSKPFGASGEHRWNNITMYEENGGKWNRLDAEFSIDDDTQATVEYNKYWGNENTQFGQLAASSNIQVGVKYSF
jgi:hypothetical protein